MERERQAREDRMRDNPHDLLVELYKARKARDEAYGAMRSLSERIGVCDAMPHGDDTCFRKYEDQDEWCDICKQKQPFWEAYHQAANKAGAALRACLAYGKEHSNA